MYDLPLYRPPAGADNSPSCSVPTMPPMRWRGNLPKDREKLLLLQLREAMEGVRAVTAACYARL